VSEQKDQWRGSGNAVGVTREEEIVYLELCRLGTATTAELAEALTSPQKEVLRLLTGLHGRRLVRMSENDPRTPWSATAPDVAIERVLSERERAERRLREEITRLLDGYHRERGRRDPGRTDLVEVVTGRDAIAEVWLSMQAGARREVAVLDKAPFVQDDVMGPELEALGRGVACRAVYERSALLLPGHLAKVRLLIAAGEEAVVVTELPFKLAIVDRRWALLPVASGAELDGALIVRPSPMLDALAQTFEAQWARAMPIPGTASRRDPGDQPGGDGGGRSGGGQRLASHELLTLLTAGMTDDAIARQLQVSARTVQRRVSELMGELGARNRFQAGVQAVRRGLL
jgi:sugar-specific transcriptional regulator TrmB/DNA-binding CsgD family transcriptional regulator